MIQKQKNRRKYSMDIWIGWKNVKNKNRSVLFLLIFAWITPVFASLNGTFITKKFGAYTVLLSQRFDSGIGKITIERGKNKIYEESEVDHHYYFGNNFDETLNGTDPHSGRDITGNGLPNLIVSNWTGGAHCCHFLQVFELGKKFKKLVTVEAHSSSVRLVDLDHDSFPEIEFWDGSIDYLFASFAGSPPARVVLKFQKDHYEIATHLMKKPAPTAKQMQKIKERIRAAFEKEDSPDLPYDFLNLMMDLSYTGHFELALKMADEIWPKTKPDLSKFKEDFTKALQETPYWKNF
ncbi:MAG: hypothetical protein HY391_03295 [Deltaproteobacteria bacterium]|nr:hypothetical protein [Deltaproteobacteria bacterium]